ARAAGATDRDAAPLEVRKAEVPQHPPAIDVRIGAHAAVAFRRECGERRHWTALGIEELLGTVALHPRLEAPQVLRVLLDGRQRYLMRSERAFDLLTIDHFRPRPSLGRAQDDRRPPRTAARAGTPTGLLLDHADLRVARVDRGREARVPVLWVVALGEVRLVAVAAQQIRDLVVGAPA